MALRQSTIEWVQVALELQSTGRPATGILPSDMLAGGYTAVKGDGATQTDVSLTNGVDWIEVSATKAPGLYWLKIAATEDNVLGSLVWSVQPTTTGNKFFGIKGGDTVTSALADISTLNGLLAVRSNTAAAGGASTITLDAGASATTDLHKGQLVLITSGTGAGQVRLITAYNGGTQVATVAPNWKTNPDNTSKFSLLPNGGADVQLWSGTAPNVLVSGRVDSQVGAYMSHQDPLWLLTSDNTQFAGADVAIIKNGSLIRVGYTAQAGTASSITLDGGANATTDYYKGAEVLITGGTGTGQARAITAYNGATKVASIAPNWAVNPDNTSVFDILAAGGGLVVGYAAGQDPLSLLTTDSVKWPGQNLIGLSVRSNTAAAGGATSITLDAGASATDQLYRGHGVEITAGTGIGQVRLITNYVGMTQVATVAPAWATNPDNTSKFTILPQAAGEYIRWIFQALYGRMKIDSAAKTQAIYAEDGSTTLRTSALKDLAGAATATAAAERVPT